jgi:hypothetical protein
VKKIPIQDIKTQDEARQIAMNWQSWQVNQSFYYAEIYEWAEYFGELAEKFDLVGEFKENGII